jgi:hypothetical protein
MKVELPKGIAAIHGKIGNLIFRSRKQPDGSFRVFVHKTKNNDNIEPLSSQYRAVIEPLSSRYRE